MAHFAKIENETVVAVHVIANDEIVDEDGVEQESLGIARCNELIGEATWVQTSYNGNFRKNYAGRGFTYDQARDAFIESKPYPSWLLNEDTCRWDAPTAYPSDGKMYEWDEDTTSWVEIN